MFLLSSTLVSGTTGWMRKRDRLSRRVVDVQFSRCNSSLDEEPCAMKRARSLRSGFTLVELLMSMAIVALLAALAVPRWARLTERSVVAAMRTDVRNLAVLEESHFYDVAVYTSDLSLLGSRGFVMTAGVQLQITEATNTGWSASASHANTVQECHLFVGTAAPVGSATEDGRIDCR